MKGAILDTLILIADFIGLEVIDVISPTQPIGIGRFETPYYAEAVAVSGDYIYVANGSDGLRVIDISNPANPIGVGHIDTKVFAGDVAVAGDYAFIADASGGLPIISISSPSQPEVIIIYNPEQEGFVNYVAASESFVYVLFVPRTLKYESLLTVDILNPSQPVQVDSLHFTGSDIMASGDYLYVANGEFKVNVLDISNRAHPTQAGFFFSRGCVYAFHTLGHGDPGVNVRRNQIYLTWGFNGLYIFQNELWEGEKGDVTADGTIDVTDIIRLVNIIIRYPPLPTEYELWASDFNGDAEINVQDVVKMVKLIIGRPTLGNHKVNATGKR